MSKINIRPLKQRISVKFPGKMISQLLANEPDELEATELVAKLGTWLAATEVGDKK